MKVTKGARKRIYSMKGIGTELKLSEREFQQAKVVFGLINRPKKDMSTSKKIFDQASVFRSNVGKFISSERDETASAIGATKRDPVVVAEKYRTIKG